MYRKIAFMTFMLLASTHMAQAQRNCGHQVMMEHLEAVNPGAAEQIRQLHERELARAQDAMSGQLLPVTTRTSASVLIPVVFHIVLDTNQFIELGGAAGIEERINTQMKVINDDFNAGNADQVKIPSVWASLFANTGVGFGLAHVAPGGGYTPGYDVRIVPVGTSFTADDGAKSAKFNASGGTDCWDNNKYLNIWVVNLKTSGKTALGVTAPPGYPTFTKPEAGVALNYRVLGSRTSASQSFVKNFDRGRTLTHELGHFFYLWHTWGDDGGTCVKDDGFSDTPTEADASTGSPAFPRFDACTPSGSGVMFMNYMDYCDDTAMYMFTKQQSAMINTQISLGGNAYSLTLNPNLSDTQYKPSPKIIVAPNPTKGLIRLQYDYTTNPLKQVVVYNMLGQKIIETNEPGIMVIDLSVYNKGVYFVHCYFENEIIKQKILLD